MELERLTKIYNGKARADAVKLFCKECMGYDEHRGGNSSVTYMEAAHSVSGCESRKCPLYAYRNSYRESVAIDWLDQGCDNAKERA